MNSKGNQEKRIFLVRNPGGRELHIEAKTGDQAKRIFCKAFDIRPGDPYCGIRALTARKLTAAEAEEWEAQAGTREQTAAFIMGMLDIHTKAHQEAAEVAAV